MRNILGYLFLLMLGLSACSDCDYEPIPPPPFPAKKEFIITGRLLASCQNSTPIANQLVILYPVRGNYSLDVYYYSDTTDEDGNFSIKGFYDIPELQLWYGDAYYGNSNVSKVLFQKLKAETFNFGDITTNFTTNNTEKIRCIVRYSLKHSTFQAGDSVILDYHLNSKSNIQKIYKSVADFAKPDTIFIDESNLRGLLHPNFLSPEKKNLMIKLRTKGFGNELNYAITDNCNIPEITITIP